MTTSTSRVAIVTGGSGGIGRASALRLAADGTAVVVHYAGNRDRALETVRDIETAGGRAIAVGGDVADEREMLSLFDAAEEAFGGIDVLVHTAGIMPLAPIAELDLETFDRVQRTNVRGTFVVDQLAARRLRAGGAIVNFSTSVTRLQIPGYGAYAASKGAVEAITLILARELRGRDITVNAVAPGPTATPLFFEGKSQEQIDGIAASNPMTRLGTPQDIAETVAFLAGPGRWVNGQVLYVNGGAA
ncbi:SDR family oxidoreductase [Microbacterium fluvii]|uniref:SDR family oxidoreductase n=1 Tax=Microbacterium fluvii TaxID=415215 RepID=A0ABW2HB25_9MICO|nr:SDR family oxidoreductase [Microbacterium fluvii]MCU4671844.1 SDR family oxidoreductase [Microbacterium fluvii]